MGPDLEVRSEDEERGSREPDVDVLIIGAGPTGLTTANYLGQCGVRVLVIDQSQADAFKLKLHDVSIPLKILTMLSDDSNHFGRSHRFRTLAEKPHSPTPF